MKTYIKIFILFVALFSLFTTFFLFTLYRNKEYVKANVEKNKARALVSLILAIRKSYLDSYKEPSTKPIKFNTTLNLKDEEINKNTSETIRYNVSISVLLTKDSLKTSKKELEIISYLKNNKNKVYYQNFDNGSIYAEPIISTKKYNNTIENNKINKDGDFIGVVIIKSTKNIIANFTDSSFKKVSFYTTLFFLIILVAIFILLKRLLEKDNEFTKKLQEEVKNKTQELNASNKELVNTNVELIKLNTEYLVQNEELSLKKEQLKQKIEELTYTKEELEKRNKTILKREAELIKSHKKLIDFNEAYQKQNDEYSLLIKRYIELNEDLQKQNKNLEIAEYKAKEANEFKSQFLANMSHEIRTPMNAILGFSEILKAKIKDADNKEYVSNIIISGNVLINLINDILNLSKIEAGQLKIVKENINLYEIINNVPNIFSDLSKKKKIPVNVEIKKSVPKFIITDGLRLNQILINLVGNALKFTEKGNVCISVDAMKKTETVFDISIKICDTGIGIPTDQLYSIFDVFRQVEGQNTRKYGGTGLGLSITKRLVKMLGGKIHVKSKVGEGTTFSITLKDVKIGLTSKKELKKHTKNIKIKDKVKILHAEDNDMNRQIISFYSEEQNFEIKEVTNGQEAIEALNNYTPDIILMDIQMPVLDGYQATKIIRKNNKFKNIPILALTANATSDEKKKFNHVFDGYITKPVLKDEFLKAIARFIEFKN